MGCERYLFKSVGGSPKSLKGWCVTYPVIPCFESFFLEGSSSPHVDEQTFTWKSKFFSGRVVCQNRHLHMLTSRPSLENQSFFSGRVVVGNHWSLEDTSASPRSHLQAVSVWKTHQSLHAYISRRLVLSFRLEDTSATPRLHLQAARPQFPFGRHIHRSGGRWGFLAKCENRSFSMYPSKKNFDFHGEWP